MFLSRNRDLSDRMTRNARAFVSERYFMERLVRDLKALCRRPLPLGGSA